MLIHSTIQIAMMAVPRDEEPLLQLSSISSESELEIVEKYEEETPTASHAFAEESKNAKPGDKGASQIEHGTAEVRDLGWNDEVCNIPNPVVGSLDNEELWTLIRRFDKQVFHVKRLKRPPLGQLDLNIAEEEEFSPEKLRAQLERFYMVVLVSVFSLWKHIVRLRSWKEYQRTSLFLAVYTVAWLLDLLIPTMVVFAIVLILSDRARMACFPPAPPALIDAKSGGVQKPAAGVLASKDSVTGAPEKHEGEAVEQEAHNFVTTISAIIVSTAVAKQPQADEDDESASADPAQIIEEANDAKDRAAGEEPAVEHDRTKKPVSDAVWAKARPTLRLVANFIDTWERLGNALNPTAPFHIHQQKVFLALLMLMVLFGSYWTSSYMAAKGNYPRWVKYVELCNTILKGVPTNAQLTITLLRAGESNSAPLPPPPFSDVPPPVVSDITAGQDLDRLAATSEEIEAAIKPELTPEEIEEHDKEDQKNHKKSHRLMNLLRGTAKGGVRAAFTADKAKAKAGARQAKNRLGVVKDTVSSPATGPIQFPARYKGKKGHAYITTTATTPAIGWTANIENAKPAWIVAIGEITELTKVGGLGWKSKMIVGWATGNEIVDGLVIKADDGRELHLTAVMMRDQLFNRLISIGSQMWEMW
ncbi:hypothetical protein G7Z17_g3325 [Cylindrodendrum hubeiense]|uniref:Transmembrane protein n=1 Tax=Cylindrodendrum hubeiense TaxID=595255 RepID=A0A9P5LAW6_9HYPO|nr:hypothetical protein G7Z17_g3325 [Cylindrodendrum hubeiense]